MVPKRLFSKAENKNHLCFDISKHSFSEGAGPRFPRSQSPLDEHFYEKRLPRLGRAPMLWIHLQSEAWSHKQLTPKEPNNSPSLPKKNQNHQNHPTIPTQHPKKIPKSPQTTPSKKHTSNYHQESPNNIIELPDPTSNSPNNTFPKIRKHPKHAANNQQLSKQLIPGNHPEQPQKTTNPIPQIFKNTPQNHSKPKPSTKTNNRTQERNKSLQKTHLKLPPRKPKQHHRTPRSNKQLTQQHLPQDPQTSKTCSKQPTTIQATYPRKPPRTTPKNHKSYTPNL